MCDRLLKVDPDARPPDASSTAAWIATDHHAAREDVARAVSMLATASHVAHDEIRTLRPRAGRLALVSITVLGLALVVAGIAVMRMRSGTGSLDASIAYPPSRIAQLTRGGEVDTAALSPDGMMLAYVAGRRIVVRGSDPDASERVVTSLPSDWSPAYNIHWSPSQRELVVNGLGVSGGAYIVRLDDASLRFVPHVLADFVDDDTLATLSAEGKSGTVSLEVRRIEGSTVIHSCALPDVDANRDTLAEFVRLGPGRFAVAYGTRSSTAATFAFVTLTCWRSATVQSTVASFAASADGRWLMADTTDTGGTRLTSADWQGNNTPLGDVAASLTIVGGTRRRIYGTNESVTTTLHRLKPDSVPERLFETTSRAGFSLGPDPSHIAWVDASSVVERPSLRITSLGQLSAVGPVSVRNAGLATWSPDATRVASRAVRDDGSIFVEVVDANTKTVVPGVTIDRANRFALPS